MEKEDKKEREVVVNGKTMTESERISYEESLKGRKGIDLVQVNEGEYKTRIQG